MLAQCLSLYICYTTKVYIIDPTYKGNRFLSVSAVKSMQKVMAEFIVVSIHLFSIDSLPDNFIKQFVPIYHYSHVASYQAPNQEKTYNVGKSAKN